jgi:hypothetical protein
MSTTREVTFEPLALDGSNYASWSIHVLNCIMTMGPLVEKIIVVSILPPHLREIKIDLLKSSLEDLVLAMQLLSI